MWRYRDIVIVSRLQVICSQSSNVSWVALRAHTCFSVSRLQVICSQSSNVSWVALRAHTCFSVSRLQVICSQSSNVSWVALRAHTCFSVSRLQVICSQSSNVSWVALSAHACFSVSSSDVLCPSALVSSQFPVMWYRQRGPALSQLDQLLPSGPRAQFYRPLGKLTGNLGRPKLFPIGPRTF